MADSSFKFDDFSDPNIVHSGGVFLHPTKLIFCKFNTTGPADANI